MTTRSEAQTFTTPRDSGALFSVLTWLWVGFVLLGVTLGMVLLVLLGGLWWDKRRVGFRRLARLWGRTLSHTVPFTVELRGQERIGPGPYVICANHQSVVDTLVTYLLPLDYTVTSKSSWFRGPLGPAMRLAGYIEADEEGLRGDGRRWLTQNVSVLTFPEGTRSRSGSTLRFRRGPFLLAEEAQVPVLPVAIAGTNDVCHPGTWRFLAGQRILIEILEPIQPAAGDSRTLRQRTYAQLAEHVATLRAELAEGGQGPTALPPEQSDVNSPHA